MNPGGLPRENFYGAYTKDDLPEDLNYGGKTVTILVDAAHADGVRKFAVLTDDVACNTSDHCPVMIEWGTDRFPFPKKGAEMKPMKPLYESRKASFERAVYRPNSNVIAPPAAAVFATGAMGERMKQEPPQTVFFRVFPDLTVRDGAGVPVGTLYDCLDGTRNAIPVLYLDDLSVSQALVSFVWENALGDAALCVPIALAKQAEELFLRVPHLRRILDCRAVGVGADWFAVSERAWSVGAVGLLISADQTDWDTLNLLHERGHSIWCDAAGREATAIFAGADGILTDSPARVYGILRALPEHSRTRRYRLLAHKGYQDEYRLPENSIRAVVRGAELGLDGAEIDIKLTRDGIPFVIHNPTTKAMLTGEERVVETLTAAELEARERTDFPGERTDRLEKMLAAVSCRPHYPVFVEFKPAQKFYHIERMAHAVREILARTGTERGVVVLGEADEMRCLANLLPGQPKLAGVWEKPQPPETPAEATELLWRLWGRVSDAPAGLCVEDVMVNRLFAGEAALRGIRVVVWTRSWYSSPSLWENDGERSDEGFLDGYSATISDHADKYLHIPLRLEAAGDRVTAVMRDGTSHAVPEAEWFALPDGTRIPGVRVALPTGKYFYLFGQAI